MQKQTSTPHAGVGDGSTDAASFTVDPGHVFDCADSQQVVAKLAWTVKDPTVTTVNIVVVDKTSAASKTFAEGGNAGQATTAKWVSDGTRRVWWAGADQFGLELPSCWRIGDKPSDMAAAIAAKVGHRHLVEHPNNLQVITQSLARMTA